MIANTQRLLLGKLLFNVDVRRMRVAVLGTLLLVSCCALVSASPPDLPPIRWTHGTKPQSNIPADMLGDVASATIELHESLFRKIANAVLPAIIADAKRLQIPGKSAKHFRYSTIVLSEFGIDSVSIDFAAPSYVVVHLTGLSLQVPQTDFSVFTKILFIHLSCSGTFKVSVSNTDVTVTLALVDNAGVLGIQDISADVAFGSLNIDHDFPNFFCKVGQDIIQLFIGSIDNIIRNTVEKDISPIMTKALTAAFQAVADKMKLPLVSAPVATANSISFDVDLLHRVPPQHGARATRQMARRAQLFAQHTRRRLLRNSTFPSRDIEVFVPQSSANVILADVQESGALSRVVTLNDTTAMLRQLIPAAYNACPDCPLQIEVNVQSAPTAQFMGSAGLSVTNTIVGINAVNGSQTVDLVDLLVNASVLATNFSASGALDNVVKFAIAVPTFGMSLYRSAIGPIDTSLLQWLANTVIQDILVPDFNKKFNGLPIAPIANVTVSEIEVAFPGAADVGLDITLPPL